jgi:hypothetical protein
MPAYTTVAHTAIWLAQRLQGASHGSSDERIGPHVALQSAAMAAAVVGTSAIDDPKDVSGSTNKEIEYVTHSIDKEFEYVKASSSPKRTSATKTWLRKPSNPTLRE